MRTCQACGKQLSRRPNEKPGQFAKRITCDRTCGALVRRRSSVDYVTQDCGFWSPCWVWQLARSGGYGVIWSPTHGRSIKAHRKFYEERYGPIREGAQIDHLCRNPACVNPNHLEAVSQQINVRRGANAKLSLKDVEAIKALEGQVGSPTLGRRYDVSAQTIWRIWRGTRWGAPLARKNAS